MKYCLISDASHTVMWPQTLAEAHRDMGMFAEQLPHIKQFVLVGWTQVGYDDTVVYNRSKAGFTTSQHKRLACWRLNEEAAERLRTAPRDHT